MAGGTAWPPRLEIKEEKGHAEPEVGESEREEDVPCVLQTWVCREHFAGWCLRAPADACPGAALPTGLCVGLGNSGPQPRSGNHLTAKIF